MTPLRPRTLPPGFIPPCLPTKAPRPPAGAVWLHEIKHDGFRVIARKDGEAVASISIGHDALDWYFEPGATVADRAGIWNIFKIPEGAKVQEEADKVLLRLHEIAQKFGGFAGNFIWRHTR
jgi:hypothetical protein